MSAFSAVVLAAGEGSRLRPLTRNRPKPMLPAATKPILARVFDRLIDAGSTDITVVVGYQRERVQSYFGPSYRNVPLTYVRQRTQLGTGHALLCARDAVSGPILVINGDQLVDQRSIEAVQSAHRRTDAVATLGVLRRHDVSEYGGVLLEQASDPRADTADAESTVPVAELVEQPRDERGYRLNAGVYALEPAIFDAISATEPQAGEHSLIDAISRIIDAGATADRPVQAVESEGLWSMQHILGTCCVLDRSYSTEALLLVEHRLMTRRAPMVGLGYPGLRLEATVWVPKRQFTKQRLSGSQLLLNLL